MFIYSIKFSVILTIIMAITIIITMTTTTTITMTMTMTMTMKKTITSKILWDMNIQCDHVIAARRPDIVVADRESNKVIIVDIASSSDHRVYEN